MTTPKWHHVIEFDSDFQTVDVRNVDTRPNLVRKVTRNRPDMFALSVNERTVHVTSCHADERRSMALRAASTYSSVSLPLVTSDDARALATALIEHADWVDNR